MKEEAGFDYEEFKSFTAENAGYHRLTCSLMSDSYGKLTYSAKLMKNNQDFVGISLNGAIKYEEEVEQGKFFKEYDLKFHISLPEKDKDTGENSLYSQGWKMISRILMENRVVFFKIIKPGIKMSDNPLQIGKDITIYAQENPDKSIEDWKSIIEKVTQNLTEYKIPAGYKQISSEGKEEKYINGSNYVSYRYEGKAEHELQGTGRKRWVAVRIYPKNDPCEKIVLHVENQLQNAVWKETETHESTTKHKFKRK